MSEIQVVRGDLAATEGERAVARRVLFGYIDGLGEQGRRRWRRFIGSLLKLEHGEVAEIKTNIARSGPFHRRHFALLVRLFESQERVTHFEDLRLWLKLGAGHVTWMPGPKGGVFPVPKSISYAAMEEGEMREFHDKAVEFLRTDHAAKYLWPKLPAAQRTQAIEAILSDFGE